MPKRPIKMHKHDMVKIDSIVFEVVEGGGLYPSPPPGSLAVRNTPDRIGLLANYALHRSYIRIHVVNTFS